MGDQLACMTCFVPDQAEGSPFKVSVHAWWPPAPSQTLQAMLEGSRIACFEARVYIDGSLVG